MIVLVTLDDVILKIKRDKDYSETASSLMELHRIDQHHQNAARVLFIRWIVPSRNVIPDLLTVMPRMDGDLMDGLTIPHLWTAQTKRQAILFLLQAGRALAAVHCEARDIKQQNVAFVKCSQDPEPLRLAFRIIDPDQVKSIYYRVPALRDQDDEAVDFRPASIPPNAYAASGEDMADVGLQITAWAILNTCATVLCEVRDQPDVRNPFDNPVCYWTELKKKKTPGHAQRQWSSLLATTAFVKRANVHHGILG